MAIKSYHDFLILADETTENERGCRQVAVRVPLTPGAGESNASLLQPIPSSLLPLLQQLETRQLEMARIIELGELLAQILFPNAVRELLMRSLDRLEPDRGLRLRLQLAVSLSSLPWEYLYIQRGHGEKDAVGFLALDPRISIVRHQPFAAPAPMESSPLPLRLLMAMASPEGGQYARLDLRRERTILEAIRADIPGIDIDFLERATIDDVSATLSTGADIVHFAGHGDFRRTGPGQEPGSSLGQGVLVFASNDNRPDLIPADQFAVNLGGRGVQLVVLGACQTSRRDGENVWSSTVAALMEEGIPAAIATQDTIFDESAIAFARGFYRALSAGLILDEAVCAGRLAVFNEWHRASGETMNGNAWQDWGVPVLYLRPQLDWILSDAAQGGRSPAAQISVEERAFLEAELAQHRRNLMRLRQQKAVYAEGETPLRLLNQIDAEEGQINDLEERLVM